MFHSERDKKQNRAGLPAKVIFKTAGWLTKLKFALSAKTILQTAGLKGALVCVLKLSFNICANTILQSAGQNYT